MLPQKLQGQQIMHSTEKNKNFPPGSSFIREAAAFAKFGKKSAGPG